jgi:hypothetical protein
MQARQAELLPVPYYHVVFTLPAPLGAIAFQNKAKVYGLLFQATAETLTTIAADPKRLGAQVGLTAVLHTWGQTLDHHPHIHCIAPGGGLSPDRARWVSCRPGFFLPVRVLSRLYRRLFLDGLIALFDAGDLNFFGDLTGLADRRVFLEYLAPWRKREWVVYAKRPFAGPEQVLAYLSRYTHRVAIANSRLVELTGDHVAFRWKDYRAKGRTKPKVMRLSPTEFMRRFLMHVLPDGFHRIRHFGLFANAHRAENLARCRALLGEASREPGHESAAEANSSSAPGDPQRCPCCGGRMIVIESFDGVFRSRTRKPAGFDSS